MKQALAVFLILLAFLTAGCQSTPPDVREAQLPPTGIPQVALGKTTPAAVKAIATEYFTGRGYVETPSRHNHEMVFDRPKKPGETSKAMRIRLRMYEKTDGTWDLFGRPMEVESWRGDLEAEWGVPKGAGQIQAFLNDIQAQLNASKP